MSDSKITMIGLYKWKSYENGDLFELMNLPEGIDKDTVVANILEKSSEFEVMYPDAEYVHDSIKFWSKRWYWTFDKWIKAINIEYDPLYNYDRTEEWTDNNTHSDDDTINSKRNVSGDITGTDDLNQTTHAQGTADVEVKKSAYDSSSYSPYEKTISATTDDGTNQTHDETVTHSTSVDDYDESKKNAGQFENVHRGRMYGNIGVTTSQQMLQSELDVAMFNLYDQIADIFINEYCIPVYI